MEKLRNFVNGNIFKNFILIVIIINTIMLGLLTIKNLNEKIKNIFNFIDILCLAIYVIEMVLKMIVHKFFGYFKSLWNCFDFFIILCSIISEFSILGSIQIMRAFRIFRSLRSFRGLKIISSLRSLQLIISAIGKSIPGIIWTSVLMIVVYYLFSVIGCNEFGEEFPDWFGTIPKAMYTLFQVMTLESWSMGISRPVMEKFPYAWIYFIPFLIISSFITMNVVVGIVVNSISEVTEFREKQIETKSIELCNTETIEFEIDTIRDHLRNLDEIIKKGKFINMDSPKNEISIKVSELNEGKDD